MRGCASPPRDLGGRGREGGDQRLDAVAGIKKRADRSIDREDAREIGRVDALDVRRAGESPRREADRGLVDRADVALFLRENQIGAKRVEQVGVEFVEAAALRRDHRVDRRAGGPRGDPASGQAGKAFDSHGKVALVGDADKLSALAQSKYDLSERGEQTDDTHQRGARSGKRRETGAGS